MENSREAFEAFARDKGYSVQSTDGWYEVRATELLWEIWQAARTRQEPLSDVVERVARAINPEAFVAWDASYKYNDEHVKEGHEASVKFADWCNKGSHPSWDLDFIRDQARRAIAAIGENQ